MGQDTAAHGDNSTAAPHQGVAMVAVTSQDTTGRVGCDTFSKPYVTHIHVSPKHGTKQAGLGAFLLPLNQEMPRGLCEFCITGGQLLCLKLTLVIPLNSHKNSTILLNYP